MGVLQTTSVGKSTCISQPPAPDTSADGSWHVGSQARATKRMFPGYRAALGGPPVQLPAGVAEMLGLAFHEIATNAAKYGALSVPDGRVEVRWDPRPAGNGAD